MIRIKVCRLSDIINSTIVTFIYILLCIFFSKMLIMISKNIDTNIAKLFIQNNFINIQQDNAILEERSFFENIILAQLPNVKKEQKKLENKTDIKQLGVQQNKFENIENEILTIEKISETKLKVGSVKIENYTKDELDYEELSKSLSTHIPKKANVLIYHTHTSESYSGIKEYSDYYRTTDDESNVVSVGKKLEEHLSKYEINVTHDTTVHDHLSFGKAYNASLQTLEKRMQEKDYDILIDVHRDALAANETFRPTAEINGETVAKLMFVVGTNAAGLKHDEWIENLKFAIAFQERANRMYPGLFRDIHLSTSRYNQHMADKAIILEVGATGNTIEEAQGAMKYFAAILNSMK
ncbi:MAG: stage II sporulation protein P [Clostridia bacterium]|nr:stage II sporulation protein P [Clostridia bacterium]